MLERAACQAALATLVEGASMLDIALDTEQQQLFVEYAALLLAANRHTNLTAMREPEQVMRGLFLDSLTLSTAIEAGGVNSAGPIALMDVGTGAGIPGLPLKILHPRWSVSLVESTKKKARFLVDVVAQLGLEGVTILDSRAEDVGWDPAYRDRAQIVCARAVAAIPTLVELCAPLSAVSGRLLFPKSANVAAEVALAESAARRLGATLEAVAEVPKLLGFGPGRVTVVYRKLTATPAGYPRRNGLAKSRPLGSTEATRPSTRGLRSRPE